MKSGSMLTGIGVGMAIGTAAAMAGVKMMDKSTMKTCKKNTAKCVKNINSMLDSVQSMIK